MAAKGQPLADPDGSRRAVLLACLEYDINPATDQRTNVEYVDPTKVLVTAAAAE